MEFPQVDLPVDMITWTEVTEDILNLYTNSHAARKHASFTCIEGLPSQ